MRHILDPFSGTATTGIVAGEYGYQCSLIDINPFLVWFGNAKLQTLTGGQAEELRHKIRDITGRVWNTTGQATWYPQMKNIERWWSRETLDNLAKLRASLSASIQEPMDSSYYALLWIAFARVAIEHSAAAFNHISVSFHQTVKAYPLHQVLLSFASFAESFIDDALMPLASNNRVYLLDSAKPLSLEFSFDAVVTSPPYPNRISYIRELRPYMFWLGFLSEPKDAGELDWQTIGGTWGVATSRLNQWHPTHDCSMKSLDTVIRNIRESKGANGELLATYVLKYFHDMDKHIESIKAVLKDGAEVRYIVGNSIFYGINVPTPDLYAESLRANGFVDVAAKAIRKRNSKKGLFEYYVSARFGG